MDRIVHSSAVDIGGGRRGFRSKDTAAGIPGTVVTAGHMNAVQEELMTVIEASGLVASSASLKQLAHAIRSQQLNYIYAPGGVANAINVELPYLEITSWEALIGVPLRLRMPWAAIGPASISVVGLPGFKQLVASGGAEIAAGQWADGQIVELSYDGGNVQVLGVRRGTLLAVRYWLVAGASVYTPTPGTREIDVEVQGAGGGGSGVPATDGSNSAIGSGGGGGAYARKRILTGFAGVTITVGAGGTTGAGVVGGNGGASSFGALVSALGGTGGQYGISAAQTFYAPGGAGGSAGSSGDVNIPGTSNAGGLVAVLQGITFPQAQGMFGAGPGAGGIGSANPFSQPAKAGQVGRAGAVIVREYA